MVNLVACARTHTRSLICLLVCILYWKAKGNLCLFMIFQGKRIAEKDSWRRSPAFLNLIVFDKYHEVSGRINSGLRKHANARVKVTGEVYGYHCALIQENGTIVILLDIHQWNLQLKILQWTCILDCCTQLMASRGGMSNDFLVLIVMSYDNFFG